MSEGYGALFVLQNVPAAMEEEFNAWYDGEHLPERLGITGFHGGRRYICVDGYPKHLVLFDLDNEQVIESEEYAYKLGPGSTPWTRRVVSRMQIFRACATQIWPGREDTVLTARLALIRIRSNVDARADEIAAAAREATRDNPEVVQTRVFVTQDSEHYVIIGLSGASPFRFHVPGKVGEAIAYINVYVPYNTLG